MTRFISISLAVLFVFSFISSSFADESTSNIAADTVATSPAEVLHVFVYTLSSDGEHYIPLVNAHGDFLQGDQVVAQFTTDEHGSAVLTNELKAGNYNVMIEQQELDLFGSRETNISYADSDEENQTLNDRENYYLGKEGLAHFPDDFNFKTPVSENPVKYWQYFNQGQMGGMTSPGTTYGSSVGVNPYPTAQYPAGYNYGYGYGYGGMMGSGGSGWLSMLGIGGLVAGIVAVATSNKDIPTSRTFGSR